MRRLMKFDPVIPLSFRQCEQIGTRTEIKTRRSSEDGEQVVIRGLVHSANMSLEFFQSFKIEGILRNKNGEGSRNQIPPLSSESSRCDHHDLRFHRYKTRIASHLNGAGYKRRERRIDVYLPRAIFLTFSGLFRPRKVGYSETRK